MFKKLSSLHNERSFRDQDFVYTLCCFSLKQYANVCNATFITSENGRPRCIRPARPSSALAIIPRIGEQIRVGRDFELVWGDFLHGFYAHRLASYFAFHLQ
jgi:hypothetical protein